MNIVFKPFVLKLLIVSLLAMVVSHSVALFMPKNSFSIAIPQEKNIDVKLDVKNKFIIFTKEIKKKVKVKKVVKKTGGEFLLKDFVISGISYDGKDSLVMIRGGKFLSLNDTFKGYKLVKIYPKKAKFEKNGNYYFAFLSPDDEKKFKGVKSTISVSTSKHAEVTGSVARDMFETIKHKNGKYYIPKDMLLEYKNINKIFSSIGIQTYLVNKDIKFKIVYVRPNSVFSKIGLRKGDFIVKINNKKFQNVSEPFDYFNNLENLKSLNITVTRSGQQKELKYEIY